MGSLPLEAIGWPMAIRKVEDSPPLYLVEDAEGRPMAYTHSIQVARLVFASPGMLSTLGALAEAMARLGKTEIKMDPGLRADFLQALDDANNALQAALATKIL